jgi:lysophospholipase L1-like esterase
MVDQSINTIANKSAINQEDGLLGTQVNTDGSPVLELVGDLKTAIASQTTYMHPRGIAEYAGTGSYGPAQNWAYANYMQVKIATRVKRIKMYMHMKNISSSVAPIIEVKVYRSSAALLDIANQYPDYTGAPSYCTLVQSNLYFKGNFNTVDGNSQTINLDSEITLAANEYLYVYVYAHQGCNVGVRIWNANSSSTPDRNKMWYCTNTGLTPANWSAVANRYYWAPASYGQSLVPLILEADYADALNTSKLDAINTSLLSIPNIIYVAAGRELNIWTDSLFPFGNSLGYSVQYLCTKGIMIDRGYRYTPVIGEVGDYTLTISVYDANLKLIGSARTVTIRVVSNVSGTGNKKILKIGDSLEFQFGATELINLLGTDGGISGTFIGTYGSGANKFEGRSGWSFSDFAGTNPYENFYKFTLSGVVTLPSADKDPATYVANTTTFTIAGNSYSVRDVYISGGAGYIIAQKTSGSGTPSAGGGTLTKTGGLGDVTFTCTAYVVVNKSPFHDGTRLNIQNYISVNGLSAPDVFTVQLGINDSMGALLTQRQIDDIANDARKLVEGLVDPTYGYPSAKVIISLPPFGAKGNDAFSVSYGNIGTIYSPENFKSNLRRLWANLVAIFDGGNYSANVRVSASGLGVDRVNGFGTTTRAISSRVATLETIYNNGVHPNNSGQQQISDFVYSVLRSFY